MSLNKSQDKQGIDNLIKKHLLKGLSPKKKFVLKLVDGLSVEKIKF